jgi:hypothetical protein
VALLATALAAVLAGRGAAREARGEVPVAREARPWRRLSAAAAVAVLVVGAGLRVRAAATLAEDRDEQWARSTACPVFNADHDAWVHPPLFRTLQQARLRLSGQGGAALASLPITRLASAAAGIAALAVLALAVCLGRGPAWRAALLVPAAVSPAVVQESVLARPYALTALLLVIVWWALALDLGGGPRRGRGEALRWAVALAAGGLAAWADLVGGLVAAVLLCLAALDPAALPGRRARAAAVLAVAVWLAALAPGGLAAARHQGAPVPGEGRAGHDPGPDLGPGHGLGRGSTPARLGALLGYAAVGVAAEAPAAIAPALLALAALVAAARRPRRRAVLGLVLVVLGLTTLGVAISLRTRNVLFLPYVMALALLDLRLPAGLARRPAGS